MRQNLSFRIFQNAGLVVIALGLLFGGVQIIRLGLPFWSPFYGLTAYALGIIMSLVAFIEIAKSRSATVNEYHEIPCANCGKMTLVPFLTLKAVCSDCQMTFIRKIQTGISLFLLLTLPAIYHLTQLTKNMTQQARSPAASPVCEAGVWTPEACRCGVWNPQISCLAGERGRDCLGIYFCCNDIDGTWSCRLWENPTVSPTDRGE